MSKMGKTTSPKNRLISSETAIYLGLFLLAVLPRIYDLQRFVTADEAKWVYRSAQFLAAFLNGDLAGTSVNFTPAVTTTWLGSLGLMIYYLFDQGNNLALVDWLVSLPEFRTELPILAATRWPMAIFTSLGVVLLYRLARPLFGRPVALIGAVFIALDPHTISLSRIIGHDAPAAILMMISLLLLLDSQVAGQQKFDSPPSSSYLSVIFSRLQRSEPSLDAERSHLRMRPPHYGLLILSGIAAGLAFLSKAPALFLIPFALLIFLSRAWLTKSSMGGWIKHFLVWGLAAYLTFVIVWPAAWIDPLGRPWAVIENAFISATDQEEADDETYWLVPDLGPFYYLAHGAFKLSPLVTVGLGVALFLGLIGQAIQVKGAQSVEDEKKGRSKPIKADLVDEVFEIRQRHRFDSPFFWLTLFALLFTVFMTLGDKRSPRYILPIFPALAFIAAGGWYQLYQKFIHRKQTQRQPLADYRYAGFVAVLILSGLVILLPYMPYYFSYFNPLAGGPLLAPRVVKYGWGEGLDQVGRFLQRVAPGSRVGTPYASTLAPYFEGRLSDINGDRLDYVVLYSKQRQSGQPSPEAIHYYDFVGSVFSVGLNGLHYGDVYPGPALQPTQSVDGPLAFRPLTPYAIIGEPLEIDVVWRTETVPPSGSMVTLRPLTALGNGEAEVAQASLDAASLTDEASQVLAEGPGSLTPINGGVVVNRHTLAVPDDLTRGSYALFVDTHSLGEIELRRFQTPDNLSRVGELLFGNQIRLAGYQINPSADFIGVTVAWQSTTTSMPDYTVFAQILEAETNERVAGIDTQPLKGTLPTSQWLKGEIVMDEYLIAIPFDFSPGYYKVIIGLYQPETGQRLQLTDGQDFWLVPWTFIRKE